MPYLIGQFGDIIGFAETAEKRIKIAAALTDDGTPCNVWMVRVSSAKKYEKQAQKYPESVPQYELQHSAFVRSDILTAWQRRESHAAEEDKRQMLERERQEEMEFRARQRREDEFQARVWANISDD